MSTGEIESINNFLCQVENLIIQRELANKAKELRRIFCIGSDARKMKERITELEDLLESLYLAFIRNRHIREKTLKVARKLHGINK